MTRGRRGVLLGLALLIRTPGPTAGETLGDVYRRISSSVVVIRARGQEVTTEGGIDLSVESHRIGQVVQCLRSAGVFVSAFIEPDEKQIALARQLGFLDACSVAGRSGADLLMERTDGAGVDVCFEAAGVPATFGWACRAVASGGRVVILGNPAGDVTLPRSTVSQILRKEAVLQGIWNSDFRLHDPRDDWQTALDAMADGRLVVGPLISHRVALEEAPGTLRDMFERKGIFHKVLIGGCEDRRRPPSAQ